MFLEKCIGWAKFCSGTIWSKHKLTFPKSPPYEQNPLECQNFKKKIFGFHHLEGVLYLFNTIAISDVIEKYLFCQFDSLLHSSWVSILFIVLCFHSWLWIRGMPVFLSWFINWLPLRNTLSWMSCLNISCRNRHCWATFKSLSHFIPSVKMRLPCMATDWPTGNTVQSRLQSTCWKLSLGQN